MRKTLATLALSATIIGGCTSSTAQTPGTTTGGGATTTSPGPIPVPASPATNTREIQMDSGSALNFVHHVNNSEITQAQEALPRLQNQAARDYAQTLITEHTDSEQRLTALATRENTLLYDYQPATFEVASTDALRSLSAAEFDRGFVRLQQQGHQRALQDMQLLRALVTDPEAVTFLEESIQHIQRHLGQATSLLSQLPTQ